MRSKTLRGIDSIVFINGRPYSVCTELTWTVDYGLKANHGIDVVEPVEIQSTRVKVSGTVSCLKQHLDGGIEAMGVVPVLSDLSRERYFYLQIVDRQNDSSYLEIPKAKCGSQQWRAVARGVVQGSFTFEGIGYVNDF